MSELKRELDEVSRGKEALERLSYQLIDEMRNTKNKVEQQQVEFHSSTTDLKNKGKKLEEENRQMVRTKSISSSYFSYRTYTAISAHLRYFSMLTTARKPITKQKPYSNSH